MQKQYKFTAAETAAIMAAHLAKELGITGPYKYNLNLTTTPSDFTATMEIMEDAK